MRERLVKLLLDRALPATRPEECFLSAGPVAPARKPADSRKRNALLAEFRKQRATIAA